MQKLQFGNSGGHTQKNAIAKLFKNKTLKISYINSINRFILIFLNFQIDFLYIRESLDIILHYWYKSRFSISLHAPLKAILSILLWHCLQGPDLSQPPIVYLQQPSVIGAAWMGVGSVILELHHP